MNVDTLQHHGVKGMRWGHRKQLRAEKKAYKKQFKADLKEYSRVTNDYAGKLLRGAESKIRLDRYKKNGPKKDKLANEYAENFISAAEANLKWKNYISSTAAKRGKDYVERLDKEYNRRETAKARGTLAGIIVGGTATAVGLAYVQAKFG